LKKENYSKDLENDFVVVGNMDTSRLAGSPPNAYAQTAASLSLPKTKSPVLKQNALIAAIRWCDCSLKANQAG